MTDEYLSYDGKMSEEHWAYLMHLAELADREIRLMDKLLEEKYAVELELYHHQ